MFFLSDFPIDPENEFIEEYLSEHIKKFKTFLEYIEESREMFFYNEIEEAVEERLLDEAYFLEHFTIIEEVIDKILERFPLSIEFLFFKGMYCLKLERYEEAEYYFTKCNQLSPTETDCLFYLAETKAELNKYDEAIELLLKILSIEPNNSEVYLELTKVCINGLKNIERGIYYFKLGLKNSAKEDRYELFLELVSMSIEFKMLDEALDIIDFYIDLYGFEPYLGKIQGRILFNKGKYEEAIESLLKAIEIEPDNYEFYIELSSICIDGLKNKERGLYYLKLGLEKTTTEGKYELFYELFSISIEFKLFDEALEIINNYSYGFESYLSKFKGIMLFNKGNYEEAIKELINIKDDDAVLNLGLCYKGLGKYEEAIDKFKEIIYKMYEVLDTKEIYYEIAECYKALGKFDDALYYFNMCIEFNYNVDKCFFNKGEIFLLKENYYKALIEFKKVINLNADNSKAYVKLADSLFNLGRKKEAIDYYKIAIDKGESDYEIWFKLGLIYHNSGDLNLAIDSFNETIQRNPNYSFAYYEKAKVLVNLKKQDEVVENLKIAIKYLPEIKNKLKIDFKDSKSSEILKQFLD